MKPKWYSFDFIIKLALYNALSYAKSFVKGMVLDIGCGSKPYEGLFKTSEIEYFGIDIPVERSANKEHKGADAYADLTSALPFRENVFDTIICTEVIEHIPTPNKLFDECYRVLKQHGHLILTTPQVWGLHEEPYDFYRYTKYGLKYLSENSGFKVIEMLPHSGVWGMVGQRISSFIHYKFVHKKNIMVKIFFKAIYITIQQVCLILDTFFQKSGDTLGNTLIAKKE